MLFVSAARYRCELTGLVGGPGLTTFYADTTDAGYSDGDFRDAVHAFLDGQKVLTSTAITWTGQSTIDYLDVATGEIQSQAFVSGFNVTGTNANEQLAPTTQGLVQYVTGVYVDGRQVRGKTFLPGITIDQSENPGRPTAGYLSGTLAQAALYVNAGVGAAIYSRPRKATQTLPARAGSIHAISGHFTWSQWAVLRGRRDG